MSLLLAVVRGPGVFDMTLAGLSDQVKSWQEIFGGGPIAAFLGLMIVALVAVFGLYIRSNGKLQREQTSHLETVRTVTQLTGAMERTWAEQLRKDFEHLQNAEKAQELQKQSLEVLTRSVAIAEWLKTQQPTTARPPPGVIP